MTMKRFLRNFAKSGIAALACAGMLLTASAVSAEGRIKWWQTTAVYQIYPKSFADTTGNGVGDIPGIIRHLDHIRSLGAGAIWLTPVYSSPMVDNGYDISDYTDIDPAYGTMEDFDRLVEEAQKRNIRIVMDLVFNHSSDNNLWFQESKQNRTNPKADWYIWRDAKPDGSAPTNWRSIFGGSAWTWCAERGQYYLHTFAPQQPDLNWENPEVRRALYDAALFWLDKGVGGFRIDAIPYIKKPAFRDGPPDGADGLTSIHAMTANTPGILDFLHEFKNEVFAGRDIFTVGEANGVQPKDLPHWVGKPQKKTAGARSSSRTTTSPGASIISSRRARTGKRPRKPWRPSCSRCGARLSFTKGRSWATPTWRGPPSRTTTIFPPADSMRSL